MARPDRSPEIDAALLRAVAEHPRDLVAMVAAQLGLSSSRINIQVRGLVAGGYLVKHGTTRPSYSLGANRRFARAYPRAELAEDRVWYGDLLPLLGLLPRNVLDIAHHGVTEMVNNAVDHSEAQEVSMSMECSNGCLRFVVADDGVGIFHKITRALDLPDERLALLELSKGKLTTDPQRHSGEGIFFTTRMFDVYRIESGSLVFDHDAKYDLDLLHDAHDVPGTRVVMDIETDSSRSVESVFNAFSSGPDDYAFARTVVPVRLAKVGDENLVSFAGQALAPEGGELPPCHAGFRGSERHRPGLRRRDLPRLRQRTPRRGTVACPCRTRSATDDSSRRSIAGRGGRAIALAEMTNRIPEFPDYPFTPRRFEVRPGIAMSYLDEGPRDGEVVVMLHGNPSWSYYWRHLVLGLREPGSGKGYRCIVPDHVGMGLSDKPDDARDAVPRYDYTLQSRVDDLAALLDHLGIAGPVTLAVHDWGGMIGFGWALSHASQVQRLIITNTAAFPLPTAKPMPWQLSLGRDSRIGGAMIRAFNLFSAGASWLGVEHRMPRAVRRAYVAPYDTWANRISTLRFMQDIPLRAGDPAWPLVEEAGHRLPAFADRPVFIGWGLRDFVFDRHFLAGFTAALPDAEVRAFDDAGHYVLEDKHAVLVPAMRAFLDAHPITSWGAVGAT
jgi:haloalkane dehalogenase